MKIKVRNFYGPEFERDLAGFLEPDNAPITDADIAHNEAFGRLLAAFVENKVLTLTEACFIAGVDRAAIKDPAEDEDTHNV